MFCYSVQREMRERWRKKMLHRMWLSVNGNIPPEKIVGYNKNRELGSYGKFLYKKRGKWEYLLGKLEKRQQVM